MSASAGHTRNHPRGNVAWVIFFLFILVFTACQKELKGELKGPLTFQVEWASGNAGTSSHPLSYRSDPMTFAINISAVSKDGGILDSYNGTVHINTTPKDKLAHGQDEWVTLKNGRADNVTVSVQYLHGTSFVWVEDTGTDEAPGSYSTGLSPAIYVANPTIRNTQETDRPERSPLKGDFVEINTDSRELIVTGVTVDGFYVTDKTESECIFNSIYVFNFSRPRGVEEGDRIDRLRGNADEYYGFTELSYPSWRVAEKGVALPEPVILTTDLMSSELSMEKNESALVRVENVKVCALTEDYETYGQWAVLVSADGSCTSQWDAVNVVSSLTAPDFSPGDHAGKTLKSVTGNLRYQQYADPPWLIYVRRAEDIQS